MSKIQIYYYAILDKLLELFWSFFAGKKINGKVLMYHHVTDDHSIPIPKYTCRIQEFKDGIIRLKNSGALFVDPDAALEIIKEKNDASFVVVTFDDVPHNVLTNAIPFLRENDIPYTLFIATSYMEKPEFIGREDLKQLAKDPLCTIGAHTMTHPMLRRVKNAKDEIYQSKKILEDIIGRDVNFLAYPYGKHSSISLKIRDYAKMVGFKAAFGTVPGTVNEFSSKYMFYLPRIEL